MTMTVCLVRHDPNMPHEDICLDIFVEALHFPKILVYEAKEALFHGCYELFDWDGDSAVYREVEYNRVK